MDNSTSAVEANNQCGSRENKNVPSKDIVSLNNRNSEDPCRTPRLAGDEDELIGEDDDEEEEDIVRDSEGSDTETKPIRRPNRVQVKSQFLIILLFKIEEIIITDCKLIIPHQVRSDKDLLMDVVRMQGPPPEIDLRNGFVCAKQLIPQYSRYGPFQGKWTSDPLEKQFVWEVSALRP